MATDPQDIDRDAKKAAKAIQDLQAADTKNAEAIEEVKVLLTKVQQTQDAYNRTTFERSLDSNNRELGRYTRCREQDTKSYPANYIANQRGAVRMIGHHVLVDPREPRSKVWRPGLLDDPNARSEWQVRAQRALTKRNLCQAVLRVKEEDARAWQAEAEFLDLLHDGPDEVRRIFADSSGIGGDWIPDRPVPDLERDVMYRPSFRSIFEQRTATEGPVRIPFRSGSLRAYRHQAPTIDNPPDATPSSITTDSRTIDFAHLVVAPQLDIDAIDDSIVDAEDELRTEIVDTITFAIDDCMTNGDTTAAHMDAVALWNIRNRLGGTTGLGTNADHRRCWDGLRRRARALTSMTTDQAAATDADGMRTAVRKLAMEHLLNSDGQISVVIAVSPEYFFGTVIDWAEFDAFDNVGALASVLTGMVGDVGKTPGGLLPGQVGFLWGRFPVVLNYCLTGDLAATGLFTGVGTTTASLQFDRTRMQFWVRKVLEMKAWEDPRNNSRTLIARMRCQFRYKDNVAATNKSVHYSYNLPI